MMSCTHPSILLAVAFTCGLAGAGSSDQAPKESMRVSSFTATVEKVERSSRGLVVLGQDGIRQAITVAPGVALYDDLIEGDVIVIDYIESVVVALKPGASLTVVEDTTASARERITEPVGPGDPIVKVDQQVRLVVTIDAVDPVARTVVYHGKDNRRALRGVEDPTLLEGLGAGDVVEITLTRARAISVTRVPR